LKNTILLTGQNGFLGKVLLKTLKTNKETIIKTCSRSQNSDFPLDLSIKMPNFQTKFDTVIHTAGSAHIVPINDYDSHLFHQTNVIGTNNLLKSLTKVTPNHFVFISSVSVYGLSEGLLINETFPLLAKDPYGKSKIDAEFVVKKWCEEHNVICTILRLPLIIGVNPPGNLRLMIQAIEKGYYFNIGGGTAKKSMVLASDIAKFILKAAEIGGTYNLTDGMHPSLNELTKSISTNLDKSFVPNMPLFIAKVLAKIGDKLGNSFPINSNKLKKITSTLTFDDSKARIAFGWNPIPVLESLNLQKDA
jgi:nucleoside-diphosphate-sugar epimerase